jgi:hypothetical protein
VHSSLISVLTRHFEYATAPCPPTDGFELATLALFLPWGRGTRGPAIAPPVPMWSERRGGRRRG